MYQQYGDRVSFLTIYIKEAHPIDEWKMESNEPEKDNVCYPQPTNLAERVTIANDFVKRFNYDVPVLIDGIENQCDSIYAGWPERLYILDEANTIVYKGETGPFGYHPEEVEAWLANRFNEKVEAAN